MTQIEKTHVKYIEFKMRTRITAEIFPNEVIASGEKCPSREDRESAKLSDSIFLVFRKQESIEI